MEQPSTRRTPEDFRKHACLGPRQSDLLRPGQHEPLKAAIHGALGVLAILCVGYNAAAWWMRREPHLLVNTCLYGSIVALEIMQIRRHCTRSRAVTDQDYLT